MTDQVRRQSDREKRLLELLGAVPEPGNPPSEFDLQALRERIDEIDRLILALLNERSTAANLIGRIKKVLGVPVYAPRREEEVLEQVRAANCGPLPDRAVRHLFERIIDETRSLERKLSDAESGSETERNAS